MSAGLVLRVLARSRVALMSALVVTKTPAKSAAAVIQQDNKEAVDHEIPIEWVAVAEHRPTEFDLAFFVDRRKSEIEAESAILIPPNHVT